jgi:signal transduction histidine kinase
VIATDAFRHRLQASSGRLASGGIARLALGLVAIAVGLVSIRTSQAAVDFSYLTESPISAVVGLAASWGLVAVGLETVRRGRRPQVGYLLAAAGIAWFLPEWSDPAIGEPVEFTLGLALVWLYPAVIGHALFAFAAASRPAHLDRVIAIGYTVFVIGLGIVPALGFDARAVGCGFCPANLIGAGGPQAFFDAETRVATVLALGWSSAAALVLGYGLARSGPMTRQVRAPVLVPGIAFLVLVAAALGRTIVGAISPTDPTDRLLRLGQAIALVTLAVGVAFEWLRARRSRARVAQVVAEIAQSPPIGGLRDHLAAILHDPELRLAYPIGNGASVDARGRLVDLEPRIGRETTPIVRDSRVVAVIEHDTDVLRDTGEIDEVVAAARLGLEHERLQADARAQLDALTAARRRIVEAGDAHRKQLERDLHDGAQQHLIALSIGLRFVERGPDVDAWIDDAAAELRLAMDDLRDVAHGIYPTVLGDEGFAAAVDALAETSVVPMTIIEMVEERFDPAIEVAAYHVVADVVRGSVGPFRIGARRDAERLIVDVTASHIPNQVAEEIADRVGAVDGSVEHVRDGGATIRLIAEIPCGPMTGASEDADSS